MHFGNTDIPTYRQESSVPTPGCWAIPSPAQPPMTALLCVRSWSKYWCRCSNLQDNEGQSYLIKLWNQSRITSRNWCNHLIKLWNEGRILSWNPLQLEAMKDDMDNAVLHITTKAQQRSIFMADHPSKSRIKWIGIPLWRSTTPGNFLIPRTHRYLANHAFTVTKPSSWNSLPDNVRDSDSYSNFLYKLKTHYFNIAFYNHIIC